jgi:hypothetical protein
MLWICCGLVEKLWICRGLLRICCGFAVHLVVQQIHNKSNKWSLSSLWCMHGDQSYDSVGHSLQLGDADVNRGCSVYYSDGSPLTVRLALNPSLVLVDVNENIPLTHKHTCTQALWGGELRSPTYVVQRVSTAVIETSNYRSTSSVCSRSVAFASQVYIDMGHALLTLSY